MHRFQTLCRLHLHKFASEQMPGEAGFIDLLALAQLDQDSVAASDEVKANTAINRISREPGLSPRSNPPVQQHTKEKTTCLSQ
jgi:hypothetical protein